MDCSTQKILFGLLGFVVGKFLPYFIMNKKDREDINLKKLLWEIFFSPVDQKR